jgi:Chalcone isomerase-like
MLKHTPLAVAAVALYLLTAVSVRAGVELPGALAQSAPELRLVGSGKMTWFGLHIYDVALWARGRTVDFSEAFALAIRYSREFGGERIAQRSVTEIERLGYRDAATLARWRDEMGRIFPDVSAGDRLTGVYLPGEGAQFYYQDRLVGMIADAEFARAFFSIWLDPRTREPRLRERLIGQR